MRPLSLRPQDMFPDVEMVRSVQAELDSVIEEGVGNIVQLLRNSETGVSSGAARALDDDAFEAKNRKMGKFKKWQHASGRLMEPEKGSSPHAGPGADGRQEDKAGKVAAGGGKKSAKVKSGGGRLTEQLVSQGLLTKDMLNQLRREWRDLKAKGDKTDGT